MTVEDLINLTKDKSVRDYLVTILISMKRQITPIETIHPINIVKTYIMKTDETYKPFIELIHKFDCKLSFETKYHSRFEWVKIDESGRRDHLEFIPEDAANHLLDLCIDYLY